MSSVIQVKIGILIVGVLVVALVSSVTTSFFLNKSVTCQPDPFGAYKNIEISDPSTPTPDKSYIVPTNDGRKY